MEEKTLAGLLEEDKALVLETIARDRTPEAAQAAVEKELDRLLYRYSEQAECEELAVGAQTALQTARNSLPLLGAVNEVRSWRRLQGGEKKRRFRPLGLILAGAGLALILLSVLVLLKNTEGALTLKALTPPVLGALCLFAGGLFIRPREKDKKDDENLRQEFLVDAGGVYRTLRGVLLVADKNLQELREAQRNAENLLTEGEGYLTPQETELFASLLEAAYARRGEEGAEEIIGSVRYYLHGKNVEIIDYTKEKENWFELLPGRRSGTMRPALAGGGRLIKKGLASGAEG